jgi:hypothetical protein
MSRIAARFREQYLEDESVYSYGVYWFGLPKGQYIDALTTFPS